MIKKTHKQQQNDVELINTADLFHSEKIEERERKDTLEMRLLQKNKTNKQAKPSIWSCSSASFSSKTPDWSSQTLASKKKQKTQNTSNLELSEMYV